MMNNGTVGPMPEPIFNTLVKYFKVQCEQPCEVYNTFSSRADEVREKLARFINASVDEVVMTHDTTEGMNFVANGLDYRRWSFRLTSRRSCPRVKEPL